MPDPIRVLYLVYWGAAEPLGQSLVLPSVVALSRAGVLVTLVTWEKPADLARSDELARIRDRLDAARVRWVPLRYHKRPKVPATAFDVVSGLALGARLHRRQPFDVIHARTFIAGNVGLTLAPILGIPLIYHNEGYYPEEQVDAGVWTEESGLYRLARRLEGRLYARAQGLILLSEKSREEVLARPDVADARVPAVVAPSCVDLNLFPAPPPRAGGGEGPLRLVYVGNVEGRYLFERVARFATVASWGAGGATLRVLTRAGEERVRSLARAAGLPADQMEVDSVPHAEVSRRLLGMDAGLHFLPRGRAEHAGSPTKIGEYWASGLPVVVSPNIGDSDRVIASRRVGVVVDAHSDEDYARSALALRALLREPDLGRRCRAAAEAHYALEPAVARQIELYAEVLRRARR